MEFGRNLTVEQFKSMFNTTTLDIKRSPKTQKLFVTAGSQVVAAVSKNYDRQKPSEFVELLIDANTKVWCLHNPNQANVVYSL